VFFKAINQLQETLSPELGILFRDTAGDKVMSHNLENAIDELVSSCFLEFLHEDLPKVVKENKNTGGLLG
jgi:hypothetical protein